MPAGFGFNTLSFANPGTGKAAFLLNDGMPYKVSDLFANSQVPGLRPLNSTAAPATLDLPYVDRGAGRPPRIMRSKNLTNTLRRDRQRHFHQRSVQSR